MDHNNTGMCKHCTHVHVPHSHHVGMCLTHGLNFLQAWQSMLSLLVSSVSFHWFDYKHHMYLHERGGEIGREGFRKGKVERISGKGGETGRWEE